MRRRNLVYMYKSCIISAYSMGVTGWQNEFDLGEIFCICAHFSGLDTLE